MEILKWLTENYGWLSISIGILFGLFIKCRRHINDTICTLIFGRRIHILFGENPADSIKAIIETIQASHDLMQVRQQISEQKLQIGVYVCGLDGRCKWSNESLNIMFGLDSSEVKGFGWLAAIHTDDRQRVHGQWMYAIKEKIAYNAEYTICNHRENTTIEVVTEAIGVTNDSGEIQCYVGYLTVKRIIQEPCKKSLP